MSLLAAGALLLAVGLPAPAVGNDGPLTGAYANLEPGGRAAGLAGSLGPLVDSPAALHWNPARLVEVREPTLEITYADLFGLGLVQHTGIFLGLPSYKPTLAWQDGALTAPDALPASAWGLGIQSTWVDLDPESYTEYDFALGYARRSTWGFSMGLVGHLLAVRSDLDETSASGFSFDLALARALTTRLNGSLILRSMLSSLSWEASDKETLPPRAQLGVCWTPLAMLRVPSEAVYDLEGARLVQAAAGVEWYPTGETLAMRGGLRWRDDGLEAETLPAAGLGIHWQRIVFNYGLAVGREDLGDTHRLDLRYRF